MDAKYIIIGGGIGGLCTAIALQRKGLEVKVYERVPKLRGLGAGLVLAPNAMKALYEMGIAKEIIAVARAMKIMGIRSRKGTWLSKNDMQYFANKRGYGNYTVHRGELHEKLLSLLKPGSLVEGKECIGIEQTDQQLEVQFADGSTAIGAFVIGADGIHSPVRKAIAPESKIRYAGYTCWRGIAQNLPLEHFSETWGERGRFGIVPLTEDRVYFFATKNAPQNDAQMAQWTADDLATNFEGYHEPIAAVLAAARDFPLLWNDIIDLEPLEKYAYDRIVLTGDAAHATTPNMGQGACMAIVDAAALANCISKNADPQIAFQRFEDLRLARTHSIVNNSWRFGRMAQLENPWLSRLRNFALSATPQKLGERQVESLYEVDLG
ncbi:MAG: FAD-dependent monooxygenase [Bacteroidota bacterium]